MAEPTLAPNALVTQFDPAVGQSVVVRGGKRRSDSYLAINTLTPEQYRFLQRRQVGADGALPTVGVGRFTGPAYSYGPSWALTLGPKTDLEVLFTSIANIITTVIGSLPYAPFDGSEIPNLVFEPNDSITQGLIRYFAKRDLAVQEPRIVVRAVRTVVLDEDPHRVFVTILFQIVGDPNGRLFSAPIAFNTLRLAA